MNPYDELLKNRSLVAKKYAAMMLNSTTFRMFKKHQSDEIRKILIRRIGDGRRLSKCGSGAEYSNRLAAIIGGFRRQFCMSRTGRSPNFGQAAKVVNLYVKHLLMLPDCLVPPHRRRRLERYAHVPLDRQILGRMWGDRKTAGEFRRELQDSGICHPPALRKLEKRDYMRIQDVLAKAPRKKGVPTIAYDYLYALRDE
jgi:hypothetical protein